MRTYPKCILIALDMLMADHVSCYGYPRKTTPNIDELAAQGTVFTDCTSAFCCTMPSFTSMLSGKLPLNHGVVTNPWSEPNCHDIYLDDECPTILERLLDAGFLTAAVDNLMNFASHPNWFARGCRHYMNATGTSRPEAYMTRGGAINAELLPWLKAHAAEDFFLFVHYWDPHGPFTQPEEYNEPFREMELPIVTAPSGEQYVQGGGEAAALQEAGRERFDEYDGATAFVDERLGEVFSLLEDLNIADDTAVIVTSDHGRTPFGRRDPWRARGVYWGTMHVPLVMYLPGQEQIETVSHPVHGTDLAPTILQILGETVP
ncbi:MAG: sulfatase, partial [Armatimonadota bacterium]